ncbi:MAG: helix-turn-helix domain-containing protein [Bryobacteraceae bacterium]
MDVLDLVADGLQNKEIAQKLHITVKTVEYHKRRLMDQPGIRTVAGLTRYALAPGDAGGEIP